jgi:hypothetical protein
LENRIKINKERKIKKKIEEIQKCYKTLDSFIFINKENKELKKRKEG